VRQLLFALDVIGLLLVQNSNTLATH
jgi:hypothetical protein